MKNLLKLITLSVVLFSATSCSVEAVDNESINETQDFSLVTETTSNLTCSNANPQARLVNNGTVPFNFKIISTGGNVILISNVMPNSSTSWSSFSEGDTTFSIESTSTGVTDIKVLFTMGNCTELDLVIDSNNLLVASQPVVVI